MLIRYVPSTGRRFFTRLCSLLRSILEEGLQSRQSVVVRLTNKFDASLRTPQRRKLQIKFINNKCSQQILIIIVIRRNSCPAASVTMFRPTILSCGYCGVTCVSLLNLRHPRGFHFNTHPEGEPRVYILCTCVHEKR